MQKKIITESFNNVEKSMNNSSKENSRGPAPALYPVHNSPKNEVPQGNSKSSVDKK